MRTVFVDTSAFYALLDGTDSFHAECRAAFERAQAEGWELVTTNYVVHETWAVLQARLGWDAVDAWQQRVLPRCEIVSVDEALLGRGEARCLQARERRLSLTDCVSLAFMAARGIREAMARDEHFLRAGVTLPG